ncbi:Oxidoreductase, Gfo/Idh/MocA family [Candidatus Burkholderia verschuerenii]|uniref:Oxidoreductase, Gfo/Idh/MocA family n=1 Tax=Candidatus Burkholderia verschuerenii TaxID=242163 RepID=A0A0L0MIB0_9BURK|nr:Gfo/Idh/MocA family oxidoreductase [Candidatus Burkholderia verschuerenii]KND61704.1 Oxidoreductase, Gfo/Idh/MocA family [Candidatus Burkholderia verschuerenii]
MSTNQVSPLRLGILGGANIARQFTRDVEPSESVSVVAVASRSDESARAFADANGIETSFGSYDAMLASPDIEAVYIPLPNSLHAEWAIKAAEHGKHVLCEKPLALNRDEAERMFDAADRHDVMLLGEGAIGAVRSGQASFGFTVPNRDKNIRMKPELGGGALLDAGSYPLSLIRLMIGAAPQSVHAVANWAETDVDIALMATLVYADGRRAQLSCAMDGANHRMATIVGSDGTIDTEYLNHTSEQTQGHPYGYLPSQMRVRRGIAQSVAFEPVASQTGSGFFYAAESFARMVRTGDTAAIAFYAQTSLDNAATLAAIIDSARTGKTVAL